MIDIEYQANKVKREMDTLYDFIKFYTPNNKKALDAIDKAGEYLFKARQYVKIYDTDNTKNEEE